MRLATRSVCIVGITTSPYKDWMAQRARNLSLAEWASSTAAVASGWEAS